MSDEGLAPGKRLSEIRQQQGLSQRRAAELSGLTHSAISTIEQDKVSPAISTLQKLLKVMVCHSRNSFPSRKNLMSRRSSLIRTT